MSDVTPGELAQIRERAEAATPGPWEIRGVEVVRDSGGLPIIQALWVADIDPESGDAEFIAHAREDVPRLLDALQAAEADRDALARKIAAAPHDADCSTQIDDPEPFDCDCWKADTGDAAHEKQGGIANGGQ